MVLYKYDLFLCNINLTTEFPQLRMFDEEFPYTRTAPTNHYKKLERLKNDVLVKKMEVQNKIIQYRIWLEEKESSIFRELDQIHDEVEAMIKQHQRELTNWQGKVKLINESFEMEIGNFATREDCIAIHNKLQELSNKRFQIPSLELVWNDKEFYAKVHTLCRVATSLPPYEERGTPIWGGVSRENDRSPSWGPVSLAIHPISEDIYIAEAKQNRIQIYSKDGKLQSSLKDKQLKHPWYICLTNTHLFATCFENNTIHKFSLSSRKRQFSAQEGKLLSGLAVGRDGIFVCVCEDSSLIKFDINLNKLYTLQLDIPKGVKMYDMQCVNDIFYVITDGSRTLQVFSQNGDVIDRLIPNFLVGRICHFGIDRQMNFILTDTNEHEIKIFSKAGKLMSTLGKKGNGVGELMYPEGIALDKDQRVFVWDFKDTNRLQIF